MKKLFQLISFCIYSGLVACATIEPAVEVGEPNTYSYTEPKASGLRAHSPYPNPDDVCVALHSNSLIKLFKREQYFLIACPKHETGAIKNRLQQGALVVGNARHWVLMRIPIALKPTYL